MSLKIIPKAVNTFTSSAFRLIVLSKTSISVFTTTSSAHLTEFLGAGSLLNHCNNKEENKY